MPLSRRQFLATGATGAAGLALEGRSRRLSVAEKPWNDASGRGLRKYRDPAPTVCTLCPAGCALLAYRDGGRVVQLGPNRAAGPLGLACARAYGALEQAYDPERVLRPLRRKGARGEGRWETVSWSEALRVLGAGLIASPQTACVDVGRPDPVAGALLGALGVGAVVEEESSRVWASREAQATVYGAALGRPDLSRVRAVALLGARPLDDNPWFAPLARDLVEAKRRGALIVAAAPYQGATGSLADLWLRTRPGTEGLLALGLLRVARDEGWLDQGAIQGASGLPAAALSLALGPYSAERVAEETGVPPALLREAAERLTAEGPCLCIADGVDARDPVQLEAAAALLSCLSGRPEAAGVRLERRLGALPRVAPTEPRGALLRRVVSGELRPSVYLAYRTNPLYWGPESEAVRQAFAEPGRVGLLVALDTHLTETARMADLVLPAAADLELWNVLGGHRPDGRPYALLQRPVTPASAEAARLRDPTVAPEGLFDLDPSRPLGEARQLGDVLLGVAEALGHPARARVPGPDCASVARGLADSLSAGPEGLLATGLWFPGGAGSLRVPPAAPAVRASVLGRLAWKEPAGEPAREDTFTLVPLRHAELAPGYANSRWGREIRHESPLFLNAGAAERLGLRAGDRVKVRSPVAEVEARVFPLQGLHPAAAALAEDFGHWAGGVAATAVARETGDEPVPYLVKRRSLLGSPLGAFAQDTRPGEVPWWHEAGPGISLPALSPLPSLSSEDPGGLRVTVRRA